MEKVSRYLIEQIQAKHSISAYLDSKGIAPAYRKEDRLAYRCPLHSDSDPSFMVYLDSAIHEKFYCFGCKRFGDIISIYSALEHLTWMRTIDVLGHGIEVTSEHKLNATITQLQAEAAHVDISKEAKNPFGEISLVISSMGAMHLERTENDSAEAEFLDGLYRIVDDYIAGWDVARLEAAYKFLCGENVSGRSAFEQRMELWQSQQEHKLREALVAEATNGSD